MSAPFSSTSPTTPMGPPPAPRRARRWLRRIVVGLLALVVGLVGAVLLVLHTDWGREQVRRQVVAILGEVFPGGVEIGRLEGSVLGTLTVRDVAIYDQQGRRAITLERGSVDLGVVALLRHTIQLEELDVEGATVLAFDDGTDAGMNLATLQKPSPEDEAPSTWRIQLDEVRLTRGAFALTRPNPDFPGALSSDHFDDIALQGSAVIEPNGPMTASITAGLRWRERRANAELRAGLRVIEGVVEVERAEASFGGLRALITELRVASPTNVAGTIELRAAEGSLRELVPTLPTSPATTLTAKVAPLPAGVLRVALDGKAGEATLSGILAVAPLLARPHATGQLQLTNVQPAALLGPDIAPELARSQLLRAAIAFDVAALVEPFSLDELAASVRASAELGYGPVTRVPVTAEATLSKRRLIAAVTGATGASQLRANADVTLTEEALLQIREARLFGHLAAADVPVELRDQRTIAGVVDISLRAQGAVDLKTLTAPPAERPPVDGPKSASLPRQSGTALPLHPVDRPTAPASIAPAPLPSPAVPAVAKPTPPPAIPALSPASKLPQLTITGVIDGTGLRFEGYVADKLHVEMTPAIIATWPRGRVLATATGVSADGQIMPNFELRADSDTTGVVNIDARVIPRNPPPPITTDAAAAKRAAALETARQIAAATAAAATSMSTATAAAATVAGATASAAASVARATRPRRLPPPAPPGPLTMLAAFGEAGALDVSASIRLGRDYRSADITLRSYRGALRGLEVKGEGGQISLRPQRQEVRGLRLRSNAGAIALDGVRAGENITASVAIDKLELAPLAAVAPPLAGLEGCVQLRASASLRGRKLEGQLRGEIVRLVVRPGAAPVDADLVATAAPQLLHLAVRARNAAVGEVVVGLDVTPPADPLDAAAWQALDRRSVRRLGVHSPRVNLAALRRAVGTSVLTELAAPPAAVASTADSGTAATAGDPLATLDGRATIDLELSPDGGTIRATVVDLIVPGAPAPMDVTAGVELDAAGKGDLKASARMAGVTANATAELYVPDRPLAPAAWALTPERLPRATLEIPSFVITESLADKLGLGAWRGKLAAAFDLQQGLSQLRGRITLLDMQGGPLKRPFELVAELSAEAGKVRLVGEGKLDGAPAVKLDAEVPLTLIGGNNSAGVGGADTMWATLPLKGKITLGPLQAAHVARALGATARTDALDSRLAEPSTAASANAAASAAAAGTTADGKPTAGAAPAGRDAAQVNAQLKAAEAARAEASGDSRAAAAAAGAPGASAAPPQGRRRLSGTIRGEVVLAGTLGTPDVKAELDIADLGSQRTKIRQLRLLASYAAGALHAELTGAGDKGGSLRGVVDLDPRKPAEASIELTAKAFELSPLARLVPTALLGVTAQLDGALKVRGLDPTKMQLDGNLTLANVRLPIANQVGALTDTTVVLKLGGGKLTADIKGNIEAGKLTAKASAVLDGIVPRSASLDLSINGLALITPMTPTIGAKLHADARLVNGRWKVDARLSEGNVRIPAEEGRVLHPIGPPADVVFVPNARDVKEPPKTLAQSASSWAAGRASSPWLEIALAIESVTVRTEEATGMVRGKLDVDIADSGLSIAGIIRLTGGDVMLFNRRYQIARAALTFDGPLDPTVDAELRHDFSQLTLTAMVTGRASNPQFHFRSSPPDYTEAQLLGFFLGGNPSSSGRDSPEAANSVAAAVASQTLGGMITRKLPVRLDVLSYQPQTTSSSGSLVAGRWITEKLLLLVRSRSTPRLLENGAEGELQYWLRRGLMLNGIAGDSGTFGLDLLWNRRW